MSNAYRSTWQFPANEAGTVMGWRSDGKGIENKLISGIGNNFETNAIAEAAHVPPVLDAFQTAGYTTVGDGGAALYKRVETEPSHAGKIQTADGSWWEIAEAEPQPEMLGIVNDEHIIDNTASWNAYFAAMKALNRPIKIKSILRSNITDTVTCESYGLVSGATATGMYIDLRNVTFYYGGTRDRVAFDLGITTQQLREARVLLPAVVSTGALQWPGTLQGSDTAIRITNAYHNTIVENFTSGFTKGIEYNGASYNELYGLHISNCKFGRVYTTYGLDPNASFTNENVGHGGRIGCTSAAALLGNAYGHVFTWNKAGSYRGQNNNRWYSGTYELGQPAGATYRVPVLFDGAGGRNVFIKSRHESDKGPAMICDGGLVSGANGPSGSFNSFEAEFNLSGGSGQQNNILEVNGAVGNIYTGPGSQEHQWSKHDLGKLVKSAGPATSAYLKGHELFLVRGAGGSPTVSRTTTTAAQIGSHRSGLMIGGNSARIGVAVDTSKIKTFNFRFNAQEGHPGRPAFYAFDASGAALTGSTTDTPASIGADDWLTAGELATWGTETWIKGSLTFGASQPLFGVGASTPYATGADSATGKEIWLSVRNEVKTVYMVVSGATNPCVLRSLEITGYSTMNVPGEGYPTVTGIGAMRVYSPVDDGGEAVKVTADPVTAGGHGYYAAGDPMGISNAAPASAAAAMWFALTAGWLAPAWTISTAYAVPGQLVTNDTGKIYQLVTAGTSAGAGGPIGTGTGIVDNTCVWDYIGDKPTSGAINRA